VKDISTHAESKLLSFRCIVPSASLKAWLSLMLVKEGVAPLASEILVLEEALLLNGPSRRALLPHLLSFLEASQKTELGLAFLRELGEAPPLSPEKLYRCGKKHLIHFARKALLDDEAWFKKKGFESIGEAFLQIAKKTEKKERPTPTFLFGFSSLHGGALTNLLSAFNVKRLYILSPSMLFWGDQCSDTEIRSLLKKNPSEAFGEALLPYIKDRQKFLANSGLIGREFLNLLEDLDLPVEQAYRVQESLCAKAPYNDLMPKDGVEKKRDEPSLLDHVKTDLLLLVGKRESLQAIKQDNTIEIHAAYTPVGEVEALRKSLCAFFGDRPLMPASVIVLATDLQKYLAAFEEVFGGTTTLTSVWGNALERSRRSFLHLVFDFLLSQGGKEDFLQMVRHPQFCKSFDVPKCEKDELIRFIERSGIVSWSQAARKRYLEERSISPSTSVKTFQDMYRHEVEKFFNEEAALNPGQQFPPLRFLSFFAKVDAWVQTLEDILPLPLRKDAMLPIATWVKLLRALLEPFFEEDGSFYAIEKVLFSLENFAQDAIIPFHELISLFLAEAAFSSAASLKINAPIILAEFGSFQPFPAEVVAILGAEEGSLPKEEDNALAYLEKLPPRLYPSSKLFDRYAFIEALLSAKKLFIGYQSYAFELREKVPYSPVVADLVAHLDSNFLINGEKPSQSICFKHSLSRKNGIAQCTTVYDPIFGTKKQTQHVDFSEIQKAAKNPLQRYIQDQFGAVDEWEENTSIFIKNFEVKMHLEEALLGKKIFSKRDHALALKTYEEMQHETLDVLKEMGFDSISPIHVEASPTVLFPVQSGGAFVIPSIECNGYKVQGAWKGLTSQGLLLFSETWSYELFQKWPEYVFRAFLTKTHGIPFEQVIIAIKDRKVLPMAIKDPEILFASWVEFSCLACHSPFPFSRDIVKLLLKKPALEELVAKLEGEKNGITERMNALDIESYKGMWEEWAERLFAELLVREES
jgi:hypothetical protein